MKRHFATCLLAVKGTVLLRHGEIKSINMGAMTMGFRLKDPAWASGLRVGDRIKFAAEQKNGNLLVTWIQKIDRGRTERPPAWPREAAEGSGACKRPG